jgi:hypothetical protein
MTAQRRSVQILVCTQGQKLLELLIEDERVEDR